MLIESRKQQCFSNGFSFNGSLFTSKGVEVNIIFESDTKTWTEYFARKVIERDEIIAQEKAEAKKQEAIDQLRSERHETLSKFGHLVLPSSYQNAAEMTEEEFDNLCDSLAAQKAKLLKEEKKREQLEELIQQRQKQVEPVKDHFEVPAYIEIGTLSVKEFGKKLNEAFQRKEEAEARDAELERLRKKEEDEAAEKEASAKKNDASKWLKVRVSLEDIQQMTFRSKKSKNLHIEFISKIDDMLNQIDSL
jgi:hypothetical protein